MRKNPKQKKQQEANRVFRILAAGAPKPERKKLKKLVRTIASRDLRVS